MKKDGPTIPRAPEPEVHLVGSHSGLGPEIDEKLIQEVSEALESGKGLSKWDEDLEDDFEYAEDEPELGVQSEVADPLEDILGKETADAVRKRETEEVDAREQTGDGEEVGEGGEEGEDEGESEDEDEDEGEGEEEVAEEEEGEEEDFVVSLPSRHPGGADEEIALDGLSEDQQQRVRMVFNAYRRSDQLRKERESFEDQRALVNDTLAAIHDDPIGFTLEEMAPDQQIAVARQLLATKGVWEAVRGEIAEWDQDEDRRQLAQAQLQLERRDATDSAFRKRAGRERAREVARMVKNTIEAIQPEDLDEDRIPEFERDALYWLEAAARSRKNAITTAEDIVRILEKADVLRAYRIDTADALTQAAALAAGYPGSPPRGRAAKRPPKKASREDKARDTGKQFKSRAARKKNAASSAPKGAASSSARMRPPKGMGVKESADWFLNKLRK